MKEEPKDWEKDEAYQALIAKPHIQIVSLGPLPGWRPLPVRVDELARGLIESLSTQLAEDNPWRNNPEEILSAILMGITVDPKDLIDFGQRN